MSDWEQRYQEGDVQWDKGEASPGLVDWLAENARYTTGKVIVPGCGFGHDARTWGKAGVDASGMNPGNFLGNRVREFRTRVHRHPPTEARETGSNALGPILFWREREVLLPVEMLLCIKPCA